MKTRSADQMYVGSGLLLLGLPWGYEEVEYSYIMTEMEEIVRTSISQVK